MILKEITDKDTKQEIATAVLYDLPDWFGVPEATKGYTLSSRELPFAAVYENGLPIGFIAMKETSPYVTEIHVMGVKLAYHRRGAGRLLFNWAYNYAKTNKYEFLQVKTLDKSADSIEYGRTREYYKSMGFREFECFPTIWDERNPCLVMVMSVK